jgi:hypothetical protein
MLYTVVVLPLEWVSQQRETFDHWLSENKTSLSFMHSSLRCHCAAPPCPVPFTWQALAQRLRRSGKGSP